MVFILIKFIYYTDHFTRFLIARCCVRHVLIELLTFNILNEYLSKGVDLSTCLETHSAEVTSGRYSEKRLFVPQV